MTIVMVLICVCYSQMYSITEAMGNTNMKGLDSVRYDSIRYEKFYFSLIMSLINRCITPFWN